MGIGTDWGVWRRFASTGLVGLFLAAQCLEIEGGEVLFLRGGDRTGGFFGNPSDAQRTENLSDIFNTSTSGGNHGWAQFRQALEGAGHTVTQVTEGSETVSGPADGIPFDFGSLELDDFDVVVFGSNNAVYDSSQADVVEGYVRRGGAALFISDANFGGDWTDAPSSDQMFLDRFGLIMNQDQGTYTLERSDGDFLVPDHPVLAGVESFDGEGVSPGRIGSVPADILVTRLVVAQGNTRQNIPPFGNQNRGQSRSVDNDDASLVVAEAGAGRVAIHFDRNTFFNTGGAGSNITRFDNEQLGLNLIAWLGAAGAETFAGFAESLPAGLRDPDDDADGDGLSNLLEYALALDPGGAGDDPFSVGGLGSEWELRFQKNALATDVEVIVELSESLVSDSWSTEGVTTDVLERTSGGQLSLRATAPVVGERRFARLRVIMR